MSIEIKGMTFKVGHNIVLLKPEEAFRLMTDLLAFFGLALEADIKTFEELIDEADMETVN